MRLLCRLGIHQWYSDSAMFVSADRCNYCNKWRDARQGALVEEERRRWAEDPAAQKRKYGMR